MEEDPLICSLCEKEQALWYCSVDSAYFCESCDQSVHQNGMVARHQHLWLGSSPIEQAQQSQQQRFMEAEPLRLVAAARKKRRSNRQGAGVGISKVIKTEPSPPIVPSSAAQYFGFEEESLQHVPFIPPPQNYSHCSEHAVPNLGDSSSAGSEECADALEEYDVDEFLNSAADYCEDESGICSFISSESTGFLDFPQMEDSLGILGFYDGREESEYAGAIRNSNVAPNCLPESEDDLKKLTANVSIIKSEKVEQFNAGQGREEDWTRQRICLRLDYEDILNVWSNKGAFCTDESTRRTRAVSVPDDSSSDAAGSSEMGVVPDMEDNGGREARVTRYREKRRTRLFSKKIRYEVRKLNAERRPRLKGRFIKRANDL